MNIRRFMIVVFMLTVTAAPLVAAENTTLIRAHLPRGAGFGDITSRGIEILSANRDGTHS